MLCFILSGFPPFIAIPDIPGAITLGGYDILDPHTHSRIREYLDGSKADVVMR